MSTLNVFAEKSFNLKKMQNIKKQNKATLCNLCKILAKKKNIYLREEEGDLSI